MPCREWKDEWVAKLYEEIDEVAERELDLHLAKCADCRATLDELGRVRATLRANEPVTTAPFAPRVVVLGARPGRAPAWRLAASWAASVLVFVSGLYIGSRLPGRSEVAQGTSPVLPVADLATRADLSSFEARVAALERAGSSAADRSALTASTLPQEVVTDAELGTAMDRLARKLRGERTRDMDFLLGEISATEWRAGKWIDETREAVRYVALRDDGRFSER